MNSRNKSQHFSTNKIIYQNYDQDLKSLLEKEQQQIMRSDLFEQSRNSEGDYGSSALDSTLNHTRNGKHVRDETLKRDSQAHDENEETQAVPNIKVTDLIKSSQATLMKANLLPE